MGARHTGSVEVTGSSPVYSIFLFPISKPVESRRVQYTFVISPNSRIPYKIYMPTIGGKEKKYGKVHKKTSAESGIRSTYQGFRYLQYALLLCLENDEYLRSICKFLYPDIAKKFSTTVDNVEHCLRTVISYCWYHGNRRFLIDITGYPLSDKPTNSEFLDILYNYLKFFPEG